MANEKRNDRIMNLIIKYKSALILLLLCAVVSILTPKFLNWNNIMNIARQTTINGIIAIGMACVILTGGIDLSVGSVLAFSTMVSGLMISAGCPGWIAGIVGVLIGGAIGTLNGALISTMNLPPFIVTLWRPCQCSAASPCSHPAVCRSACRIVFPSSGQVMCLEFLSLSSYWQSSRLLCCLS